MLVERINAYLAVELLQSAICLNVLAKFMQMFSFLLDFVSRVWHAQYNMTGAA